MAGLSRPALWSPEALADLDEIWDYYAGVAGPNVADKLIREIVRVVTVRIIPWRDVRATKFGPASARSRPIRMWLSIVVNDRPEIVRVLDGRRDIDEIFTAPATITPPE